MNKYFVDKIYFSKSTVSFNLAIGIFFTQHMIAYVSANMRFKLTAQSACPVSGYGSILGASHANGIHFLDIQPTHFFLRDVILINEPLSIWNKEIILLWKGIPKD